MRFYEVDSSVDAIMSAAMLAQTRASSMGKQGKLSMNGFLQMLANAGIMMDYDGFKTVFDTNPQLKNVIAKFNQDEITFVGDSDDETDGYEEPQTDIPDDERVSKMAKRAMRTREFVEAKLTENAERTIKVTNIDFAGPSPDKMQLPTSVTLRLNVPYDADEDDIDDMVADDLEDRYGVKVSSFETQFTEGELPPHLSKMFGKDGSQVETRTDVMKQMRDIVDNKSAMNVTFGDGKQMVDMYTASVLVKIYDKVNDANKEKIVQRVGTIEKFMKLMPKLFDMISKNESVNESQRLDELAPLAALAAGAVRLGAAALRTGGMAAARGLASAAGRGIGLGAASAALASDSDKKSSSSTNAGEIGKKLAQATEGSSPHPKGSKKYKAHMAAKHANMNEVEDDLSDKIYAGIKAGMSKDEIISKYADKDNDPLLIDVMYSRIKFKMNEGKSVNEAWQAFNEAEEKSYTVVHAKHGKEVIKATSSYGAAKKYADMKKLKSTAGVDAHLMERDKT